MRHGPEPRGAPLPGDRDYGGVALPRPAPPPPRGSAPFSARRPQENFRLLPAAPQPWTGRHPGVRACQREAHQHLGVRDGQDGRGYCHRGHASQSLPLTAHTLVSDTTSGGHTNTTVFETPIDGRMNILMYAAGGSPVSVAASPSLYVVANTSECEAARQGAGDPSPRAGTNKSQALLTSQAALRTGQPTSARADKKGSS